MLEQHTGSSKTKFPYRANNYKRTHHKYKNKKQVPKEALKQKTRTLLLRGPQWYSRLGNYFDRVDDEKFLRQRELWAFTQTA